MKDRGLSDLNWRSALLVGIMTVLCVVCFPVNPLVLTGVIQVESHRVLFIIGWVVWALGMVLVMAPIVTFPRRGGVPRGKWFVHTTRLVDTGFYAVVRHPQYTGGILGDLRHFSAVVPALALLVAGDGRDGGRLPGMHGGGPAHAEEVRRQLRSLYGEGAQGQFRSWAW